jgi:hypothetical protein
MIVAESCLDNSVSDSFGDDLLSFDVWLETKFGTDVAKQDFTVTNVDFLQTKLDYSVF